MLEPTLSFTPRFSEVQCGQATVGNRFNGFAWKPLKGLNRSWVAWPPRWSEVWMRS